LYFEPTKFLPFHPRKERERERIIQIKSFFLREEGNRKMLKKFDSILLDSFPQTCLGFVSEIESWTFLSQNDVEEAE
jgi:hypothetical protein